MGALAGEQGRLCSNSTQSCALEMKQPDDAVTSARRALEMATTAGRKKYDIDDDDARALLFRRLASAEEASDEPRRAVAEADALGSPLYRWQSRAALADAVRPLEGVDTTDAHLADAVRVIRDVVAGLSPARGAVYAVNPQVAAVLEAVS